MTIDQVLSVLNEEKKAGLPTRFPCHAVMVDNVDQYAKLLSSLKEIPGIEVISALDLFSSADLMPRYDNLIKRLAEGKWWILPGVSEYLRLFSRYEIEKQRFMNLWDYVAPTSNISRIIIPLWGCKAQWFDKSLHLTDNDIRKKDPYFDCTNDISAEQKMDLIVLSEEFQSYANQLSTQDGQLFYGLQEWYEYWAAPVPGDQYQVLLTGRYKWIQPATGSVSVRVIKDTLSFVRENIKGGSVLSTDNCPSEALGLLVESALSGTDLESAILSALNVEAFNTMDIMARWKSLTEGQKQLVILWIKQHPDESYLYYCVQHAESINKLNEPILYSIFTTGHSTDKWVEESQKLITIMGIDRDEEFLEYLENIPTYEERLQYLTGNTSQERTYLLRMVGQWLRLDASQVQGNYLLTNMYPTLIAYLDGSCYDDELRRYMGLYKAHKLENSLPDDVEMYFSGIQTEAYNYRYSLLSDAINENSVVLWIDALGIEWLPLLLWELRKDGKGEIKESHVALANLPTETMYNDQWNQMSVPHEKLDKLDKLAHKGVIDDPDYYVCVEQQLQFMSTVVNTVGKLFKNYQRVIITGDHGTSRLAARFFHKLQGVPAPQTGKVCSHGRYCQIQKEPAFYAPNQKQAKDQEGNKFIVFTDYDHFVQPGFAAGADDENAIYGEVHGGGTPEEVLVPVIVIDNKEKIPLKAKWIKNPIKIMMKKVKTAIEFNQPVNSLVVKAGLYDAECISNDNNKEWQVVFQGIKAGDYSVTIVADGKIVNIDKLSILSALGGNEVGDLP